jgi:PPOX class probable F420-dependent enzyme
VADLVRVDDRPDRLHRSPGDVERDDGDDEAVEVADDGPGLGVDESRLEAQVQPPVLVGDRAFFRSYDKAWKTKRLRNNPKVKVAPATVKGTATGPALDAQAKLLDDAQAKVAARALARRHRVLQAVVVPLMHRLSRYRTMHYELLP